MMSDVPTSCLVRGDKELPKTRFEKLLLHSVIQQTKASYCVRLCGQRSKTPRLLLAQSAALVVRNQ